MNLRARRVDLRARRVVSRARRVDLRARRVDLRARRWERTFPGLRQSAKLSISHGCR